MIKIVILIYQIIQEKFAYGEYADFGFPNGSQFVPKFRPTMHRLCMRHFTHARSLARLL